MTDASAWEFKDFDHMDIRSTIGRTERSRKGQRHGTISLPASISNSAHGAALAVTGLYRGALSSVFRVTGCGAR
ncbi:hypothetical protein [Xanthomonas oryzae]|uniref:hypothetical protein n=1 Tax=Xanthomonas oryzae TaxID=347 RepID=UPI0015EF4E4D|nr:hypothetical protein [Xanthomonas oryzae]